MDTLLRVARVCELSARRLHIVPAIRQRQSSFMFDKTTAPHKTICAAEKHERSITAAHIQDQDAQRGAGPWRFSSRVLFNIHRTCNSRSENSC
jgi:hypothetical protein